MLKRKVFLILTVVLLLLSMGVTGCGEKEKAKEKSSASEEDNTKEKESKSKKKKSSKKDSKKKKDEEKELDITERVCDRWADEGTIKFVYSDGSSYDEPFNYAIPQIVDETEDAKTFNDEMTEQFEARQARIQEAKASPDGVSDENFDLESDWLSVHYDCYFNDSIASIIIHDSGYFEGCDQYIVYNYDFENGKCLSGEDILALKSIDADEFVEGVRKAAAYECDEELRNYVSYEAEYSGESGFDFMAEDDSAFMVYSMEMVNRANTISRKNISIDMPIYLDETGEPKALVWIYDMGQYGLHSVSLSPMKGVESEITRYFGDLMDVIIREDGVYIVIYKDTWSIDIHDMYPTLEFATEYKIDGAIKNYYDASLSWTGNGMSPLLLLFSDDGMVSYVDLESGVKYEHFSAVEPLLGPIDIESVTENPDGGYIYTDKNSNEVDVEEALYYDLTMRYNGFEQGMLNLYNVSRYYAPALHTYDDREEICNEYIGFSEDEYPEFVRESYESESGDGGITEGQIRFNGMNEYGMIYTFSLESDYDTDYMGTMAIMPYSDFDEDNGEFVEGATVRSLGGYDIFGSGGEEVALTATYG